MPRLPDGGPNPYAPPAASLEQDVPPLGRSTPFRSLKPLAQTITVLLVIYMVLQVVHIAHLGAAIHSMHGVLEGGASESVEVKSIERRLAVTNGVPSFFYLPVMVLFCVFVFRANKNVRTLDLIEPHFTPGWAVGVFFVPVWNLYKPYLAMREIWQGSSPDPDEVVVASSLRGPSLLKWWWGLFVASFVEVEGFNQGAGAAAFIGRAEMAIVGHVVELTAAVLAIAVVRGVAARQDRWQRLRPTQLT
jgi:hypothetical protein